MKSDSCAQMQQLQLDTFDRPDQYQNSSHSSHGQLLEAASQLYSGFISTLIWAAGNFREPSLEAFLFWNVTPGGGSAKRRATG